MQRPSWRRALLLCLLLSVLVACQSQQPAPAAPTPDAASPTTESAPQDGYPAPQVATPEEGSEGAVGSYPAPATVTPATAAEYPPPTQAQAERGDEPYPPPSPTTAAVVSTPTLLENERFTLEPFVAGDTEVRGRGPAGLPIILINVSLGGDFIASGIIGEDSTFTIPLSSPLESNNRLGIIIGDLAGTEFEGQNDQVIRDAQLLEGEGTLDSPVVGYVVVSATVP